MMFRRAERPDGPAAGAGRAPSARRRPGFGPGAIRPRFEVTRARAGLIFRDRAPMMRPTNRARA